MDEENIMVSMSMITENAKIMQLNLNKIASDVSFLQETGVNIEVSNQVTANSNDPVSSGAVYTYVNQNLSSGGGVEMASGTASDNNKLVLYKNPGGGSDGAPSFNFAAIKEDGEVIDVTRILRVNDGSHISGTNFDVNPQGDVSSKTFTVKDSVTINSTTAGGPSATDTPFRCLGGASIGPSGALNTTTPEAILLNGVIGLGGITESITAETRYGTPGQVLTSQGSTAPPTWTNVPRSVSESTTVYMTAAASGASDGFITYSSPIVQNGTFSNNAFSPGMAGDYKVTSNLTFTGGSATVRIGKVSSTTTPITPITPFRSYDFRNAAETFTDAGSHLLTFLDDVGDSATLILDSGSAEINSTNGYIGSPFHRITFPASNWTFPSEFSIEFVIKIGAQGHWIFDFGTQADGDRLYMYASLPDTLSLLVQQPSGIAYFTFSIAFLEFQHLILRFNGTDIPKVYVNGSSVSVAVGGATWSSLPQGQRASLLYGAISINDNGIEETKLITYYHTAVTDEEAQDLYNARFLELVVLQESSGSGTIFMQQVVSLATTDSIKVYAEGDFTGYSGNAALIVEHYPSGQILTLDSSSPPQAVWMTASSGGGSGTAVTKAHGCAEFTSFEDKIYIEEEGDTDLSNNLIGYGASNTSHTHNGTTVTVYGHSNYPCIGTANSTILDDHTTTLYGMTERYTSVGVELINTAMNNGAPTEWRGNDRLNSDTHGGITTPPTRWRILTAGGAYRVNATIALVEPAPNGANWTQAWIFVRAGQMSGTTYENTTTVRVAAYQKMRPSAGSTNQIDERLLQFDEVLDLNQYDEVYIGMSHGWSTDGAAGSGFYDNYYMANIQTTFSIQQL